MVECTTLCLDSFLVSEVTLPLPRFVGDDLAYFDTPSPRNRLTDSMCSHQYVKRSTMAGHCGVVEVESPRVTRQETGHVVPSR